MRLQVLKEVDGLRHRVSLLSTKNDFSSPTILKMKVDGLRFGPDRHRFRQLVSKPDRY